MSHREEIIPIVEAQAVEVVRARLEFPKERIFLGKHLLVRPPELFGLTVQRWQQLETHIGQSTKKTLLIVACSKESTRLPYYLKDFIPRVYGTRFRIRH